MQTAFYWARVTQEAEKGVAIPTIISRFPGMCWVIKIHLILMAFPEVIQLSGRGIILGCSREGGDRVMYDVGCLMYDVNSDVHFQLAQGIENS